MTNGIIALIGLGGTARAVINALGESGPAQVRQVLVRPGKAAAAADTLAPSIQAIENLDALAPEVSLVIETAGHAAVAEYGAGILARGRDFGLISSGALADPRTLDALLGAARRHQRRLLIFNGAVGALDAISSARAAGLQSLRYTGTKPAQAWAGTPAAQRFDLAALERPTTIFEGTAREVALAYPKNANVAATLALAGLGMDATEVRLIADPATTVNRHRLDGQSALGGFHFETEALPLASNPKTSASTAYGIVGYLMGGPNALRLN